MIVLPTRFANAWDHALVSEFAETNTAKTEITHIPTTTTALKTAVFCPSREFWFLLRSYDS